MARLKVFFDVLTKVTTGILLGAATYCSLLYPGISFDKNILWQLLLVSFLTSLGSLLYTDDIKKKSMKIACILHYFLVNVIVVGCGLWFGWLHADNLSQIIGMVVLVALIFGGVSVVSWKKAIQEADLMNERLAQYQEKKELQ